ncbi:hypothetical protein CcaverHIS002_0107480 [Cutaneotrichosporon cavernicola]|uniref:Uncharacterized protein n=1 Tax=Cutaneotrichosporon cavernicola TaxID=279322 RepID=A0AA48KX90_9TREE|nr:uncharacterized protein CcaverHIS019_0107420 [Cutaneotrichosporon cavernicola]BEI80219.1 hypothetical protein CcaverHIS002_0107480 [Cutaneotrichosporon cavernicola]BEI88024.1 hypothetical protein CcaverHIS019_0107420 [Cutaneotrichosporon cavernicola]BEI95798.1 hypothetical protein CcaverHIS631_0107470 [Cutaneotrichosporon cavernicola]BEJ03571.1 hypothetical protein CcaverHIS641_0107460 [Cutaneotrichosporon cavernicola]
MSNVFKESNAQPTAAPSFLQKKGLLGGKGLGSTMSPTDNFMSPISAKLNGAKQRHFQKGKPVSLASKLSSLGNTATPTEKKDTPL